MIKMKNTAQVRNKIERAFASWTEKPEVGREIAFHMTDWDHDLEQLVRLYEQPDSLTDEELQCSVLAFLAHVPNHVAAAKKLSGMGPIEDVFSVGVLEEDED